MIKTNEEKIEIYKTIDKKKLKIAVILFIIAAIWEIINIIIGINSGNNLFSIIILVLAIVCILISIYFIKSAPTETLKIVLHKDYIEIYNKKKKERLLMKDITSITYDISNNSNEAYINYIGANGKKKTKIVRVYGCTNIKFANLANELKNQQNEGNDNSEEIVKVEEFKVNEIDSKTLGSGKTFVACFVGKTKLVNKRGEKSYGLPEFPSECLFIDSEGNSLKIYSMDLAIDFTKLKVNNMYKITYNKKRGVFNLEEEDKAKPYPFIDKIKKILSIKLLYLFDEAKIQKELNLEKDYYRICDITKLLLLLSLLILIVRPYITLLIFFGIVLLNWISFLVIRKKCIG